MDKKFFIIKGLFWQYNRGHTYAKGPYCPACYTELSHANYSDRAYCDSCEKDYFLKMPIESMADFAQRKIEAETVKDYEIVSLDVPPAKVKVKDEDEHYALWANITQKNGRRVGVVYIGEKGGKDKIQEFIDIDNQQVRHDPSNMHPKELLAKVTVEFNDGTIVTNDYKKKPN